MYCPACDKEFSPVHSRCPECKGWLRVSGPAGGAKTASARTATAPALAAQSTATSIDPLPQRPSGNLMGNDMPLPSRPSSKPANSGGLAASPPRPAAPPPSQGWGAPSESPAPPLSAATEPTGGRGALGSGWESSNNFAAPTTNWGGSSAPQSPAGWGTPAPATPAAGWGSSAPAPATPQWGSPGGAEPQMPGWGGSAPPASAPPSGGLGAVPTVGGGFASTPPAASSGGLGGGWLGDGGGSSSYSPPARSGGWLGDDGGAPEEVSTTVPAMSAAELAATSEGPALSLPDHTVAVDLGTPWEDELPSEGSNKWVYMVLGVLLCSLLGFFGYTWYTRQELQKPVEAVAEESSASSMDVGLEILAQAKKSFEAKRFEEAQASAETAHSLIAGLSVAPPEKVKEVKAFYRKATQRCASDSFAKAERALSVNDFNGALGFAESAAKYYGKISGASKEQARAVAFKGRTYMKLKDYPNAEITFRKASQLNPAGGYEAAVNEAKSALSRVAGPKPASAPPAGAASAPVEQPSMGDSSAYPTGRSSGGYRPSSSGSAPPPPPAAQAAKPRPVNTYVAPKKDNTPSWRKKPSDRLPGY